MNAILGSGERGDRPSVEEILERLTDSANVTSVFGEPISSGDTTVVPVARVAYGFGGGYGSGPTDEASADDRDEGGEGAGVGGGVRASPAGVFEITDNDVRFVPAGSRRRQAGLLAAGVLVGLLVGRRFGGRSSD